MIMLDLSHRAKRDVKAQTLTISTKLIYHAMLASAYVFQRGVRCSVERYSNGLI